MRRRPAAVLIALVAATAVPIHQDGHSAHAATAAAPSAKATSIAVYRGPGPWGAQHLSAYESFLGRPVSYVLDYQDTNSWANQTWPDWQADAWHAAGKTVVLGAVGIFPGDWNRNLNGTTVGWAQAARGDYDAHWRALGERLVATGQAGAILRGAHEFNGGWFAHRVNPGEQGDFIAAWRRWVGIMRAVPGNRFSFDWNPVVGQLSLWEPESAYPGDDWVDRVALDVYDGWYVRGWKPGVDQAPTQAERDAVWDAILNGPRGLIFWKGFAAQHGKPLSLPEWGIRTWTESDGLVHGGGDNASFIERMYTIINDPSWNIAYHAFWEDPADGGRGVSDPDAGRVVPVPEARTAFLRLFGGAPTTISSRKKQAPGKLLDAAAARGSGSAGMSR